MKVLSLQAISLVCLALHLRSSNAFFDIEVCGDPSDDCMNDSNWAECLGFVVNGCQTLKVDDSVCPTKFLCEDAEKGADKDPEACASLFLYSNKKCHGDPIKSITFQTWTKPGSPCYHDATMGEFSVKDVYCDLEEDAFKETQYFWSRHCHKHWYNRWADPIHLKFTTDTCLGGYRLDYCVKGECPPDENNAMSGIPNSKEYPVAVL